MRETLQKVFPDALIADFRQTHPIITQGLDRATTFLSLVSLIALIVGALGVATAMHAHLQQKMDSIAIMKCLGARTREIMQIYLLQTIGLGLAGGLAGVAFGNRGAKLLSAAHRTLFPSASGAALGRHVRRCQGLAIGILTTLLFTLPPLLGIRRIRPGVIFRREMAEARPGWRTAAARRAASLIAGGAILCGLGAIAALAADRHAPRVSADGRAVRRRAGGEPARTVGGSPGCCCDRCCDSSPASPRSCPARCGMASPILPAGNHAQAVLVALGIGVMFTLTVYLVQHGMMAEMFKSAPPGMPNVFLLDITASERDAVCGPDSANSGGWRARRKCGDGGGADGPHRRDAAGARRCMQGWGGDSARAARLRRPPEKPQYHRHRGGRVVAESAAAGAAGYP